MLVITKNTYPNSPRFPKGTFCDWLHIGPYLFLWSCDKDGNFYDEEPKIRSFGKMGIPKGRIISETKNTHWLLEVEKI